MPNAHPDSIQLERGLDALLLACQDILLAQRGASISEYQLLRRLAEPPWMLVDLAVMQHPERLFYLHFAVFHCLYRLQDQWQMQRSGHLEIAPLGIQLHPWENTGDLAIECKHPSSVQDGEAPILVLQSMDPLRAYYLDIRHLQQTRETDVRKMLDTFWHKLLRGDERSSALQCLGCSADADLMTIRRAYRRLAQQHHPDRGGDETAFIAIRRAYEKLTQRPT